ncbi:hypothetical protein Mapa_012823 [Marchantia paleacea]|nr:hypothetical protein Mapa_012823 [Marchantia paleacea]
MQLPCFRLFLEEEIATYPRPVMIEQHSSEDPEEVVVDVERNQKLATKLSRSRVPVIVTSVKSLEEGQCVEA